PEERAERAGEAAVSAPPERGGAPCAGGEQMRQFWTKRPWRQNSGIASILFAARAADVGRCERVNTGP
ncbi:MAG: hypothetical protein M3459_12045, partial [Actinomycetota bacterium]|nr:hypothetical protein [Actinomycetota bacterium]